MGIDRRPATYQARLPRDKFAMFRVSKANGFGQYPDQFRASLSFIGGRSLLGQRGRRHLGLWDGWPRCRVSHIVSRRYREILGVRIARRSGNLLSTSIGSVQHRLVGGLDRAGVVGREAIF